MFAAGSLTSDTRFEDRSDSERFGSIEHAVLQKMGGGVEWYWEEQKGSNQGCGALRLRMQLICLSVT